MKGVNVTLFEPLATATPELTDFEYQLYERQLALPGFGVPGQLLLKKATVMVSRVGGLGGTVALQLARAGIGRLVLAHDGVIEPENLNRMLLAFHEHLDQPRVEVFRETLLRINPQLEVIIEANNVQPSNVSRLVSLADLVVDGAPLFEERYLMNQEAVRQQKPLVMAAMFGLEGYVTTIFPGVTPCLSCIYPEAPASWNVKVFPVIVPSSAFVATIAAMEVIKVLTGCGETLANQLLYSDLTTNTFRRLRVQRWADCPVCKHLPVSDCQGRTKS
jgi:molybdopterin/thiamine biosynthesis adenylyltransferase